MFQKILVPLDMTFKHRRAVDTAAELARQSGGEMILLHVIELLQGHAADGGERVLRPAGDGRTGSPGEAPDRPQGRRHPLSQGTPLRRPGRRSVASDSEPGADLIVLTSPRIDLEHSEDGWGV